MLFLSCQHNFSGSCLVSQWNYLPTQKWVDEVRDWPVPKNAKELHSFLGLALYYCQSIPNFAHMAKCLHQLVDPTNIKKTKSKKGKGRGDYIRG